MGEPKHGLLLLGEPDEDEGDGGAMSHDGHEDSGLHTAVESFAQAMGIPSHKVDVEAACEALHEVFEKLEAQPHEEGPHEEPEGDEEPE